MEHTDEPIDMNKQRERERTRSTTPPRLHAPAPTSAGHEVSQIPISVDEEIIEKTSVKCSCGFSAVGDGISVVAMYNDHFCDGPPPSISSARSAWDLPWWLIAMLFVLISIFASWLNLRGR